MGCHFLLQGILPTQGSNPCLPHWQSDSEPPRKPSFPAEWIKKQKQNPQKPALRGYHCEISQHIQPTFREEDKKVHMYIYTHTHTCTYIRLGIGMVAGIKIRTSSHSVNKETVKPCLRNWEEKKKI